MTAVSANGGRLNGGSPALSKTPVPPVTDRREGFPGDRAVVGISEPTDLSASLRARMEGFIVIDYLSRFPEGSEKLLEWVEAGEIAYEEDIQEGIENAPKTFLRLFSGQNLGKQLLKVSDPD